MPRFFCENFAENSAVITGDDARHISRSLRMRVGESLTVCDTRGTDYYCTVAEICDDTVKLNVNSKQENTSEPTVAVTLFQCIPKGDKLDSVVQKAVELGVHEIVPVLSSRCVSRPDEKAAAKKRERLQKIANEAAKQSGRGILPEVCKTVSFKECCAVLKDFDTAVLFYELGGKPLADISFEKNGKIAVLIGPEGGFSEDEVTAATNGGAQRATLGKRILRTETAPVAALGCIMLLTGNME